MSRRVIHMAEPEPGSLPRCMLGRQPSVHPLDWESASYDVWRWLPRQAQCKRCWRGKARLHAPDDLVAGIEAMMLTFATLSGEHACWHDEQRVTCTCGTMSWTHPTAHAEAAFAWLNAKLRGGAVMAASGNHHRER
jgi:hypothetical protein